jgi:hypothetical protein
MKQFLPFLGLGLVFFTSCSTERGIETGESQFHGTMGADIVIRFYTDDVNRVLKPLQMEGPFLTTFNKDGVLDLAKQQSGRDLAVVIMLKFNCGDRVKQNWLSSLTQMGYKRVVFLRAIDGRKVDGLPILESPVEVTSQPKAPAEPKVEQRAITAGG